MSPYHGGPRSCSTMSLLQCFLFQNYNTVISGCEPIPWRATLLFYHVLTSVFPVSELRHCDFWTGASDSNHDGQWRWVGKKTPLSYTNWNHNEPNNGNGDEHCMHMLWVFGWMWNDARCNYDSACFICEIIKQ